MGKIFRYSVLLLLIFALCIADAQVLRDANSPSLSVMVDQVDAGHSDLEFKVNELSLNLVQIDNNTYSLIFPVNPE